MLTKTELTATTSKITDLPSEDVFANFVEVIYQTSRMPNISAEELEANKQISLELLSEIFDRKELEVDKQTSLELLSELFDKKDFGLIDKLAVSML